MRDKSPNELLCISCGVEANNVRIQQMYNNGTFKATVVFEWKCEQCKTINHFACYGKYVKIN